MNTQYDFTQNDSGGVLRCPCVDQSGAAINLTGATVTLKWRDKNRLLIERVMTVIPPATAGVVEYQFAAGELFAPRMDCSLRIVDATGGTLHSNETIRLRVRHQI